MWELRNTRENKEKRMTHFNSAVYIILFIILIAEMFTKDYFTLQVLYGVGCLVFFGILFYAYHKILAHLELM